MVQWMVGKNHPKFWLGMREDDRPTTKQKKEALDHCFCGCSCSHSAIFFVKGISWDEVWQTIVQADGGLLLAGVALTTFNLGMRGLRWGVLLSAERKFHRSPCSGQQPLATLETWLSPPGRVRSCAPLH